MGAAGAPVLLNRPAAGRPYLSAGTPPFQLQNKFFKNLRRSPAVTASLSDLHRKTQPDIMRVFLPDALWRIRSEFCSAGCYVA